MAEFRPILKVLDYCVLKVLVYCVLKVLAYCVLKVFNLAYCECIGDHWHEIRLIELEWSLENS